MKFLNVVFISVLGIFFSQLQLAHSAPQARRVFSKKSSRSYAARQCEREIRAREGQLPEEVSAEQTPNFEKAIRRRIIGFRFLNRGETSYTIGLSQLVGPVAGKLARQKIWAIREAVKPIGVKLYAEPDPIEGSILRFYWN